MRNAIPLLSSAAALALLAACGGGPDPYLVAFTGDTGYDADDTGAVDTGFERVLELVASEEADLLVIAGDFGYEEETDIAATYFNNLDRVLGDDFPVLAAVGNHDDWSHYMPHFQERLERMGLKGDLIRGEEYSLAYGGIHWAVVGGPGEADFVRESLADANDDAWRICLWHNNMSDMQAGGKSDGLDWETYRACQDSGAIIATAHEHSYSRTRTLTKLGNQRAGHGATGSPEQMEVGPGRTFVFVSGLGGRHDERDYHCDMHDDDSWWATVYTSNYYLRNGEQIVKSCTEARRTIDPPLVEGYTHGVLFITFNADGDPGRAEGYFKTVDGDVIDSFSIRRER